MKKTILASVLVLFAIQLVAQQRVALHSNGTTTIFGGATPFVSAYDAAQPGDTLYLPGNSLTVPPVINKQLTIYGAGHYPDSTQATNKTLLSSALTISENADSLFLEGVEVIGGISFTTNHKVDYVVISRSKFDFLTYGGSQATPCEYNTIKECVIDDHVYLDNAQSCLVTNSIIKGRIHNGNNNAISNNILQYDASYYYYTLNNVDNTTISNNIFLKANASVHSSCQSSTFSNNVFSGEFSAGANLFIDNYFNVDLTGMFVDMGSNLFDYAYDYHLTDPGSFPGTDNTQVGVYGGFFPYKTSSVPSNPHISYKNISSSTNASGLLDVEIHVQAQQH